MIGEGITHAKVAKGGRDSKCENVGKCECQNVVLKLEAQVGRSLRERLAGRTKLEVERRHGKDTATLKYAK